MRKILLDQISSLVDQTCSGSNGQRDQKVFRLYFGSGLTASAIAQIPDVSLSMKGVESTILRLVRSLRESLQAKKEKNRQVHRANSRLLLQSALRVATPDPGIKSRGFRSQ
ncbi:MAG: hypothetical protein ACR2JE_12770 [Acidobacteriaceae bacterium]